MHTIPRRCLDTSLLPSTCWKSPRGSAAGYLPRPSHSGMFRRSPGSRRRARFSAWSLPLLRLSPLQPHDEGERGLGQVRREGTGPQVGAGLYSGAWGGWDSPKAGPQPHSRLRTDGTPAPQRDPSPTEGSQPHRGPPTPQGAQD